MNKEKKISDKKIEKILNKCMILISKGYNVDFCLNKFKKYKDILEEYLAIYGKLKKATNFELDKNFLEDTLDKIYAHSSEKYNISVSKPRRNFELKPAILLSVVIVIISFSFVGIMFASQNSVPGEILYPVKRIVENFELSVYPESHMGPLHFDLLNNRLYEANKVVGSAIYNKDTVNSLLTEVDYEYRQSKKYNYFGNKTEDQILNDIKDIKIRYQKKQVQEQQENKSSEIKSNNMDFEIDGPVYVKEQNIFCYRVNIKGDKISSGLVVEFNRDDSNGIWGPYAAQINLNPGETFILTVTIPSLSVSKSFTLVGPDNPDENVETETSQDETNGDENKTTEYNQTTEGIKDIQCPVTSNAVAVPNPAAVNSSVTITAT
ncbi:MAG: hypothetical protein M1475_03975, partial [Actinobacteria bacterium]|nr:hypothetical protein [Actinomycetota bacterium]